MRLTEVARQRGATLGQTICDVLLESDLQVGYLNAGPSSTAVWQSVGRDAMELLARPDYMGCSDITPLGSMPHPRCYGAFPRIVGRLHRRFNTMSLEQLIQRLTDNPARRFGFTKRGRLQKGYFADVVVFDPQRIIDTATFDDPAQYPAGIPYVLVNGQVAVNPQGCTGVLAGQAVP
jgi:N-acyl-D-amino-acid deacylase